MDCGLILEKLRGLSAKCPKLDIPRIVFLKKTRGPSPRVRGLRRPGPLPLLGARRSTASGRSGARELRLRGGREEGRAGELNGGVAAAREMVEGRLTSGENFGSEGRRRGRGEG
jgi:hypothetical protein